MPHSNDIQKFVRSRIFNELYHRTVAGSHVFPLVWFLLGWQFELFDYSFYLVGFCALLLMYFFRLSVLAQIKLADVNHNFTLKLRLLQVSMILNAVVWSTLLVIVVLNPSLEPMHLSMILISLCIGFITPISVAVNSVMRITITLIFLIPTACVILYSNIQGRFLISALSFFTIAYTFKMAKTMYASFWRSLGNELALKEQAYNQKVLVKKLKTLSQTDGLTNLYNRLYFDECYAKEWNRACRESNPISIMLIDVDFFKKINDNLGHTFGDQCLQSLGKTLKNSMRRSGDIIARYGGEEFIILMCNADINAAADSAIRILESVRKDKILTADGFELHLTCSIGVASTIPKHFQGSLKPQELINQADIAMYKAKDTGRNKVSFYDPAINIRSA